MRSLNSMSATDHFEILSLTQFGTKCLSSWISKQNKKAKEESTITKNYLSLTLSFRPDQEPETRRLSKQIKKKEPKKSTSSSLALPVGTSLSDLVYLDKK